MTRLARELPKRILFLPGLAVRKCARSCETDNAIINIFTYNGTFSRTHRVANISCEHLQLMARRYVTVIN